jgi:anaerobic selenocysteine-containing dehydrogenase
MELQRREFLKLGGVTTVVSSAFGVVHAASASRQAVPPSGERIVLVGCNASCFITMDNEVTQPDFFVLVGP